MASIRKSHLETRDKSLDLKKAGDMAQARAYALGTFAPVPDKYNAIADRMVDCQVRRSAEQGCEAAELIQSCRMTVLVAGVAGPALLVVLSWVVVQRIRHLLGAVSAVAQRIDEGDLSQPIEVQGRGEVAERMRALQGMQTSPVRIVGDVRHSSDSISAGSSEIAMGNVDLSPRTGEQASNLEETAASMEQITSTVQNNADTALADCGSSRWGRLEAHRDQQGRRLHRFERMQCARCQVHKVAGVQLLHALLARKLHHALDAQHGGLAGRLVLFHGFAHRQDHPHDFELAGFEDGGGDGVGQTRPQRAHADDLARLGVGQGHGSSPCWPGRGARPADAGYCACSWQCAQGGLAAPRARPLDLPTPTGCAPAVGSWRSSA